MDDTVWHLIRDERQSLARTLEPLSAEQWATPPCARNGPCFTCWPTW